MVRSPAAHHATVNPPAQFVPGEPAATVKDWLGDELARNKRNADLYVPLIQRAVHALTGKHVDVLIGHHLTFELDHDLTTENEIPSADCLMFDHQLMGAVFGNHTLGLMANLAILPVKERDEALRRALAALDRGENPVIAA